MCVFVYPAIGKKKSHVLCECIFFWGLRGRWHTSDVLRCVSLWVTEGCKTFACVHLSEIQHHVCICKLHCRSAAEIIDRVKDGYQVVGCIM